MHATHVNNNKLPWARAVLGPVCVRSASMIWLSCPVSEFPGGGGRRGDTGLDTLRCKAAGWAHCANLVQDHGQLQLQVCC